LWRHGLESNDMKLEAQFAWIAAAALTLLLPYVGTSAKADPQSAFGIPFGITSSQLSKQRILNVDRTSSYRHAYGSVGLPQEPLASTNEIGERVNLYFDDNDGLRSIRLEWGDIWNSGMERTFRELKDIASKYPQIRDEYISSTHSHTVEFRQGRYDIEIETSGARDRSAVFGGRTVIDSSCSCTTIMFVTLLPEGYNTLDEWQKFMKKADAF
jgi:hypothetical protein